jgi:ABC-2 type transport system permease protein
MSLVRAERRRFAKRRMTVWMLVIGVFILGAVATGFAFTHAKRSAAVIAAAEQRADQEYAAQKADWDSRIKSLCLARAQDPDMECRGPSREDYQAEWFMPAEFGFKSYFGEVLIIWAAIIAMIGFVLGATFVGADWSSGSMMNLLTWRPKRMQVLGTKLMVLMGWMTGIGVLTFLLWTGALWLVANLSGTTSGMTPGTWQSFGLYGLRGLGMILAFSALGFALASLGRHTAAALGVAIGVIVVGQIGLSIVLELANVQFAERFLVPVHMYAWLHKEVTLVDYSGRSVVCDENGCQGAAEFLISYQTTGLYALAVVALVTLAAFWSIKRRDVA